MEKNMKNTRCPGEQHTECVKWVMKLFKDCLCNFNDEMSFGFGIASLIFWGVAEIPQIVTNFNNKSADGVSLAFISTWILGDAFNLIGCILEPATTKSAAAPYTILHCIDAQVLVTVLYTATTIVLALQCIYYDHFLKWTTCLNKRGKSNQVMDDTKGDLKQKQQIIKHRSATNSPVEVPKKRDFYFRSARSLAGSSSPLARSYIMAKSGPPALESLDSCTSSDDETPLPPSFSVKSPPRHIPRPSGYGTFLAATAYLPLRGDASNTLLPGRRSLIEEREFQAHGNAYGQGLGWLMAAIYMGGRLPQIWLNIQRGSVEGLNPLMFIFALIANVTYVASILVRRSGWDEIQANMPWLLDAIVCVALDLFIIMQYIYYRFIKLNKNGNGGEHKLNGDFVEAK